MKNGPGLQQPQQPKTPTIPCQRVAPAFAIMAIHEDSGTRGLGAAALERRRLSTPVPRWQTSSLDSVRIRLRKGLRSSLKVEVPSTLVWSYLTIGHLVGWCVDSLGAGSA